MKLFVQVPCTAMLFYSSHCQGTLLFCLLFLSFVSTTFCVKATITGRYTVHLHCPYVILFTIDKLGTDIRIESVHQGFYYHTLLLVSLKRDVWNLMPCLPVTNS